MQRIEGRIGHVPRRTAEVPTAIGRALQGDVLRTAFQQLRLLLPVARAFERDAADFQILPRQRMIAMNRQAPQTQTRRQRNVLIGRLQTHNLQSIGIAHIDRAF